MAQKRILVTDSWVSISSKDYFGYDYAFLIRDEFRVKEFIEATGNALKENEPLSTHHFDVRVGCMKLNNVTRNNDLFKINTKVVSEAEFAMQKFEISKGWVATYDEPPRKQDKPWWMFW